MLPRNFNLLALGLIVHLPCCAAATWTDQVQELVSRSPFGNPQTVIQPAGPEGQAFEFRAVVEEKGRHYFSIHDNTSRRSCWITSDDSSSGFEVKAYDEANLSLTLERQGKLLTLHMQRARVPTTANPAAAPNGNSAPAAGRAKPKYDSARIRQNLEDGMLRRAAESLAKNGTKP